MTPSKSKHPAAGKEMTGAEIILQVMSDEGVDTIFGYSGGAILPTYDAIFRWNDQHKDRRMRLIVPANEQGAGFMAAGYSRVTGKVGVSIVTSGPGATNSITPVRDCMSDSIPMVLISGQVARPAVGTDAFQEAPVFNLMSSAAKHVFMVNDEKDLEVTVRAAFYIARSGRPGPVVIDVPKDVQNHRSVFKGEGLLPMHWYEKRTDANKASRMSKDEVKEFFTMLKASRRPLLYVGGGVILAEAAKELRAFVDEFKIPVVTTLTGLGAIDTTHELCLNMLGMHGSAYANYAVEDCDLLIAIGARFDDRVAGVPKLFAPHAKIVHFDIDAAEIGKVKPVDWFHVGDAKSVLHDLLQHGKGIALKHENWLKHVKAMKKAHPFDYDHEKDLIQPQMVLDLLNRMTKGEAIICTGVGQHQMFAAQYFDFKRPRSWVSSGSMGTMGFGLPAAIGAKVAMPDKTVIDVDGDGSIRMNIGELETCANYDIPVKVLLLNNRGDGMVVQWQTLYYEGRYSGTDKTLHRKDFVKIAEADGFEFARRVEKKEDLQAALEAFLAYDGPAFLEVLTDKHAFVYPMVGPGLGYKDMMTGPHIPARELPPEPKEEKLDTSDAF